MANGGEALQLLVCAGTGANELGKKGETKAMGKTESSQIGRLV